MARSKRGNGSRNYELLKFCFTILHALEVLTECKIRADFKN